MLEELQTAQDRHPEIQDDRIRLFVGRDLKAALRTERGVDREAFELQQAREGVGDARVIVHDQARLSRLKVYGSSRHSTK